MAMPFGVVLCDPLRVPVVFGHLPQAGRTIQQLQRALVDYRTRLAPLRKEGIHNSVPRAVGADVAVAGLEDSIGGGW